MGFVWQLMMNAIGSILFDVFEGSVAHFFLFDSASFDLLAVILIKTFRFLMADIPFDGDLIDFC